jgi:hypothetical protein
VVASAGHLPVDAARHFSQSTANVLALVAVLVAIGFLVFAFIKYRGR